MKYTHPKRLSSDKEGKLKPKQGFLLALCGSIIGFVNGFFGGGGGMICVPLLENVLKIPSKYSHATAIVIIFPISLISAFVYVFSGVIESLPLVSITAGTIVGGILGAVSLKFLPSKVIRVIFAFIMLAGGIRMIF